MYYLSVINKLNKYNNPVGEILLGLFIVSYRTSTESSYDGYCILKIYDNNPVLVAITGMKDNAGVVASLSCNKYTASTNTISMNIHSYCNVLFITF